MSESKNRDPSTLEILCAGPWESFGTLRGRARWFLWNVSANSHMTSVTKRNMLDPTGKVGDCSYTRHNHHPLGWIFLQGKIMIFFSFFIFSESIACIMFWIFISYQTEHIVAIIVFPTYFQHPAPALHMWLKKSLLRQGKNGKNKPKNHQHWNLAKIEPKSDKFTK